MNQTLNVDAGRRSAMAPSRDFNPPGNTIRTDLFFCQEIAIYLSSRGSLRLTKRSPVIEEIATLTA